MQKPLGTAMLQDTDCTTIANHNCYSYRDVLPAEHSIYKSYTIYDTHVTCQLALAPVNEDSSLPQDNPHKNKFQVS